MKDKLPPPLDFEGSVKMLGGDRAMLLGLLAEFSGHLEIQLEDITVALAEEDVDIVCKISHSIKGGAAVLAAHSLMKAATVLEESGKAGDLPKSEECALILAREVARLRCYCEGLTK